jgi:type I pantothenate kinase
VSPPRRTSPVPATPSAPSAADLDVPRFEAFTRPAWARLRASTPLTLTEDDLEALRGLNERLSIREVEEVYLPLSRLLNLKVAAFQGLAAVTDTFLGRPPAHVPYVIGIAGSVAVGKSTTARVLQALLARWPPGAAVDLVTTDGFLFPNAVLESAGLMERKGFPESYDVRALIGFLAEAKAGRPEVRAPVYSHLAYDVMPGEHQVVRRPDVLVVEGLNVLQTGRTAAPGPERSPAPGTEPRTERGPRVFVSDFFDFRIYVDAEEASVERWYVERFHALRRTVFRDPSSYFHRYAALSPEQAEDVALGIWRRINAVNLRENIAPTRSRADLILQKGPDHEVERVLLRP